MKKIIIFFFLFISLANIAFKAYARETTFDQRENCVAQQGIWREFGNGCANDCNSVFDEYSICTQALTFGCDCLKDRCWHQNKCVKKSDYKIIFDRKQTAENKAIKEKIEKRAKKAQEDPSYSYYLQNLYVQKQAAQNGQTPNQPANASAGPNPPPSPINNILPPQSISDQNQTGMNQPSQLLPTQNSIVTQAPPMPVSNNTSNQMPVQENIPGVFLQYEKDQNAKKSNNPATTNQGTTATTSQLPKEPLVIPQVPLP